MFTDILYQCHNNWGCYCSIPLPDISIIYCTYFKVLVIECIIVSLFLFNWICLKMFIIFSHVCFHISSLLKCLFKYFSCCCFGAYSWLCSEIIPGNAQGTIPYVVSDLATCKGKLSVFTSVLSLALFKSFVHVQIHKWDCFFNWIKRI